MKSTINDAADACSDPYSKMPVLSSEESNTIRTAGDVDIIA